MDELVKLLDTSLKYISHEIVDSTMYIRVESILSEVPCPFCGQMTSKVHSRYERSFQDLPIQGKEVIFILENRKMFCRNPECKYTTFAERFKFLSEKSKKTKRLEQYIVHLSLNMSTVAAAELLSRTSVKAGRSTVSNLIKKSNRSAAY